jgi:ADP-ribosylation factor related protein 1
MFSLLASLFKWLFSRQELHILILGLDHAGKTTLLEQSKILFKLQGNGPGKVPLDRIPPTVGLNIARLDIGSLLVLVWDLGGQTSLRQIWQRYYAEAQGLVFVVDASSPARFAEAKLALDGLCGHPDLRGIPFLLLANKQDLVAGSADAARLVDEAMGFSFSQTQRRPLHVQAISALSGRGVLDAMQWIASHAQVVERAPVMPTP